MKKILFILAVLTGVSCLRAASPTLSVTSSYAPQVVQDDGPLIVTVQARNDGTATANNVALSNALPPGVTFVGSVPPANTVSGNSAVIVFGNLSAGAVATAVITGRVSNVLFGGNEAVTAVNESTVVAAMLTPPIVIALPVPIFTRRDFGDAPDPTYPVLLANNGARHRTNALFLGARVDAEPDGQPSPMAYGDDVSGANDEDGVVLPPFLTIGALAKVGVTASMAGVLDVWADFNSDGDWFGPGEHVIVGAPVPAGPSLIPFPVPAWAVAGNCFLRFRLSPNGAPSPVGFINGGEVEDYVVEVRPPSPPIANGIVKFERRLDRMRISWDQPNALLQVAPSVNGPWTTFPDAVSPFDFPAGVEQRFFRVIESRNASRSGLGQRTFASMSREADLIIDAVVTGIAYRNSDGDGTNTVSWPHTFVTLQVLDVLKGRIVGTNLCLRFLGGLDADGDRILRVSHSTLFDVGERSILFVRRNGFVARPLLGGSDGRLRIVNGLVYSEHGQRLVLTASQRLAFGDEDDLAEMHEDIIGTNVVARVHSDAQGESPRPPRATGDHLSVAVFKTILAQIIQQNHTPQELQNPILTLCADSARAFRMLRPRERPGPVVPPTALAAAPVLDEEAARVKANGGNPVLK